MDRAEVVYKIAAHEMGGAVSGLAALPKGGAENVE